MFNIHRARVKRGFSKKPIRAAAAKEAGQGMSTEVNGCAPGSKLVWVRIKIFRGGSLQTVFLCLLHTAMKTRLVLKPHGNLQSHGQPAGRVQGCGLTPPLGAVNLSGNACHQTATHGRSCAPALNTV